MSARLPFTLHSSFKPHVYRAIFADTGRIRIAPFLDERSAQRLAAHLADRDDWRLILNAGASVFELDRDGQNGLSRAQQRELDEKVVYAARAGFQYRFESLRVPDAEAERCAGATLLTDFAMFMSSKIVLAALRAATGLEEMRFADAQATSYGPGHFLNRHDDDVEGKNRLAAYVFGLTPDWLADWGGLLLFHDAQGGVAEARVPRFNALDLFAVPQPHSVSLVAPFAGGNRNSVTGWLRSAVPGASGA